MTGFSLQGPVRRLALATTGMVVLVVLAVGVTVWRYEAVDRSYASAASKLEHSISVGDANPAIDPWAIELPGQVGRLAFGVPYAGYALVFASTAEARAALIALSGAFLLVGLLRWIWRKNANQDEGDPVCGVGGRRYLSSS